MPQGRMTALELTGLKLGDTLVSTADLSGYPDYHIGSGARFVVVENQIGEDHGSYVAIRLAPADKAMMTMGDISEWCDSVHLHEPLMAGEEHDAGTDPKDREASGNAWTKHTIDLERAPDALTLVERIAAVFAHKLAASLDDDDMAEVIRRNAAETDPTLCHSHDVCDPNVAMLETFEEMGLRTPLDALEDKSVGSEPEALWGRAWETARTWFVAPSWAMEPRNDDEDEEALPRP